MRKNNLLIDEYPLLVLPSLAVAIGLNEAIALQQIHYWINNPKGGVHINGERWVYNTYEDWQKDNFPFWSVRTVQRVFARLEEIGLIVSMQKAEYDRKKYYRPHYAKLASWNVPECHNAEFQNGMIEDAKMEPSLTETTRDNTEIDNRFSKIQIALEKIGILLTSKDPIIIDAWLEKHTDEYIQKAIDITQAKGIRNIGYVKTILAGWLETGYPDNKKNSKKPTEPKGFDAVRKFLANHQEEAFTNG